MKIILRIGTAGFIGTLVRYGGVRLVNHLLPDFPWDTAAVNIAGALIAGFYAPCPVRPRAYFSARSIGIALLTARVQ